MKIGKETETLEFKKTTAELKEAVISMAAMLNKHGGGEMYFGVRNDGTVLGQQIGDATLRDISQAVSYHIEPKVFPKIELAYIDDKPCIHVAFNGDEALINSFCHKNFRTPQNNEVAIFSNRIEIYNPGTFPAGVTPEDFIKGTGRSVHRNPLLAQIMYYSKDIESFGTGLKRIADACKDTGIKYEFAADSYGFTVIFYRPPLWKSDTNGDGKPSRDTSQDTSREHRTASILEFCALPRTRDEIQKHIGITNRAYFSRVFMKPLLDSGQLVMTVPDKPSSRNQKYLRGKKNV